MATIITSEETIPINEPFKVTAGPGAGKTHWLINHIKNVVSNSHKLDVVRKVACITYTNVGIDTITSRLNMGNDVVEVCTIHSFLYANVVKPYVHLVAEDFGLKLDELVVIDDSNFKSEGRAALVLRRIDKSWLDSKKYLGGLKNATWRYENHEYNDYKPNHPIKVGKWHVGNDCYMEFKRWLWSEGYMSFDDILYFSYILLSRYPNIYKLIKAKYPYIFVDEFQDTIPFVVDFLSQLGNDGVIVGVVGDKAQSIYDFLGATVQQFESFTVLEMQEYEIRGNRRSTKQIIDLLNIVRTDFSQDWLNGSEGMKPELLVGDMLNCYQQSVEQSGTEEIQSLAFQNILANSMRKQNGAREIEKILEIDFDSNAERQMVIKALIKAVEYTRMNDLRNAWHQLDSINRDRTITIVVLRRLLDVYKDYKDGSLMDFYNFLVNDLHFKMAKITGKAVKDFYVNHTYADAALGVKYGDSNNKHKTIHKSKGEEFDNVFVILQKEEDLGFLLSPNLNGNNVHRVYYVAASRAIKRLFICVPTLSEENHIKLRDKPISIPSCV
ncbi:ATP-dependent helicase [Alloprevotella sp. OH1205_COT-284]|uniref:ATP-dependent helicase n=1 Tax=Alloprevotella sp. OH1205_COT-284 TaxID=2491043 RepID=UPI000F5F8A4B|nr:ATP-dependent helicase [Alloprevotella sp. OH1205_COT-284]RRD75279.1 ATP-dependent helicase [Alloprevotella sp. OH1205_COT-284]